LANKPETRNGVEKFQLAWKGEKKKKKKKKRGGIAL
jgi:hypothetical protein